MNIPFTSTPYFEYYYPLIMYTFVILVTDGPLFILAAS